MNIILKFFLLIFLFNNSYAEKYKILGYYDVDSDFKYKNSKEALRFFAENFTEKVNLDTKIISFDNYNDYIESFLLSDIDLLVINPYNYLSNYEELDQKTIAYWHLPKDEYNNFQSMYLVVNKNSKIKKFSQLDGKKIVLKKNNYLGKIFLEDLYLKKNKTDSKKFMSKINYIETNTELLKVYFGTYDACIVDSYNYDIMYKLNPSIEKNLEILEISPKIFSNLLVLLNNRNNEYELKEYQNKLNKVLKELKESDLFNLMKVSDVNSFSIEEIRELKDFYNEFKVLKQKYNK